MLRAREGKAAMGSELYELSIRTVENSAECVKNKLIVGRELRASTKMWGRINTERGGTGRVLRKLDNGPKIGANFIKSFTSKARS